MRPPDGASHFSHGIRVHGKSAQEGPTATNPWVVASIEQDVATVVARVFDKAHRRDPTTPGPG